MTPKPLPPERLLLIERRTKKPDFHEWMLCRIRLKNGLIIREKRYWNGNKWLAQKGDDKIIGWYEMEILK